MKRSTSALFVFLGALVVLMCYALQKAEQGGPGQRLSSSHDIREADEDARTYSTSTTVFASSTLDISLTIPPSGAVAWKTIDIPASSTDHVYAAVRIVQPTQDGQRGFACASTLLVLQGRLRGDQRSIDEQTAFEVAGNDRVRVYATNKTLCGARLSFNVGSNVQAVYAPHPSHFAEQASQTVSTQNLCLDYALETTMKERGDTTSTVRLYDALYGSPLFGERPFDAPQGDCPPFMVRLVTLPNDPLHAVLFAQTPLGYHTRERPLGLISISPEKTDSWTVFSWPGVYEFSLSPDLRYIVMEYETLIQGKTRRGLIASRLETQLPIAPRVLLADGRMVGLEGDPYPAVHNPFHWVGSRRVDVTTVNLVGQQEKTLTFSF